jgi:hypothetical protein
LPTSSSMCAAGARRAFPTGRLASRVFSDDGPKRSLCIPTADQRAPNG